MPTQVVTAASSISTSKPTSYLLESIDLLRGLLMLPVAVDHTREFFTLPLGDPRESVDVVAGALCHALDYASLRSRLYCVGRHLRLPAAAAGQVRRTDDAASANAGRLPDTA
jgi:hypothetical protein